MNKLAFSVVFLFKVTTACYPVDVFSLLSVLRDRLNNSDVHITPTALCTQSREQCSRVSGRFPDDPGHQSDCVNL